VWGSGCSHSSDLLPIDTATEFAEERGKCDGVGFGVGSSSAGVCHDPLMISSGAIPVFANKQVLCLRVGGGRGSGGGRREGKWGSSVSNGSARRETTRRAGRGPSAQPCVHQHLRLLQDQELRSISHGPTALCLCGVTWANTLCCCCCDCCCCCCCCGHAGHEGLFIAVRSV
jgi:hypothetical protein